MMVKYGRILSVSTDRGPFEAVVQVHKIFNLQKKGEIVLVYLALKNRCRDTMASH